MGLQHGMSAAAIALSMGSGSAFFASNSVQQSTVQSSALFARKPFITGNWKLNPQTKEEALELASGIASQVTDDSPCDVALFVPYPFIESVQSAVGDKFPVGAEVITPELSGAFTGAISAPMLKSVGSQWSLAGHSERRTIVGDTDDDINRQCKILISQGMSVILCTGETLAEFEKSLVGPICEIQLKKGLAGIAKEDMSRVAVAYEPVWAIGTGMVCIFMSKVLIPCGLLTVLYNVLLVASHLY
jgi:triosephosphate isomerase